MSNLTRWQLPELSALPAFDRLFGLRDELDRLFGNPFAELSRNSQFLKIWNPAIDLYENADTVTVKVELPGMKKEEIDVSLHDGVLSISGERKSEKNHKDAQTHRSERFVGVFQRSITLPTAVKADQTKAEYKEGILTITLPKAEEAKRKQIEINVS